MNPYDTTPPMNPYDTTPPMNPYDTTPPRDTEALDVLAQTLYAKDKTPGEGGWPTWQAHSEKVRDIWRRYAERFLASDWLAARDAAQRAAGAETALREAAGDLLLACSHFNRYKGQPEWCGYCEAAVDSMVGGRPNYKQIASERADRIGGTR